MAPEGFKRKLTAILSADVEGYSRLMSEDEEATVRTLTTYREVMTTLIQQHSGKVLDSPGDNLLADFTSVVDAVQCAVSVQKEINSRNAELPEDRKMQFRIGINLGDVIQEEDRIYGDGVNIAARLEGLSEPGGICISKTAFDHIESKLPFGYEFLGDQTVKNIARPVGAYRVLMEPRVTVAGKPEEKKPAPVKRKAILAGAVAVLVLAIAAGIWQFYMRRPSVEPASVKKMAYPLPDIPSIAVLPFVNMSGDPEQEYFSDGVTESIISTLSNVDNMFVIARNSTFTYKGKAVKIQQVAEELGVRYVLEGSIQKSEERVRITVQLIDAITGKHLWSERYDRDLKDLFALQDEITMKIITALRVKLTEGERVTVGTSGGTDNLDAYLKYLQANKQTRRWNKEGNALARKFSEEAIALDSKYADAYLMLSATHLMDMMYGSSESLEQSLEKAEEMVKRAIALRGSFADARAFLGRIYLTKRKYDEAIAEGERALALALNSSFVHAALAFSLGYAGRPEEAIPLYKKAIRLSPIPESWYLWGLGDCYRMVGRYEEAISVYKRAIKLSPDDVFSHAGASAVYALWNRDKEAKAEAAEVLRIDPKFSLDSFRKGQLYKDPQDLDRLIGAMRKAGLPEHTSLPLPDKPSIAVLPFTNMSGDPEQEYFSDGLTEEIITALSKTPRVLVIARHSAFTYKGKSVKVQQVGQELGVRYLLEGSVRKSGDKVRITAQLIDTTTGKHLWAERYDRDLKDVFAIQDEITLEIIRAMQVELTEGEKARVTGRGTKNLDAYLKAIQAHEQMRRAHNRENNLRVRQLAMEAISLDPHYGYPYAILAGSHLMDKWLPSTESPEESMRLAIDAAQKALDLDDSDYRIHIILGLLYVNQGKYDKALAAAQRAVELCPGGAEAYKVMGTTLDFACRASQAIPMFEKAIKLNPLPDARLFYLLAAAYQWVGRYEDAIIAGKKALQLEPNNALTHFVLVRAYTKLGRNEEARTEAAEVLSINPKFSLDWYFKMVVKMMPTGCHSKFYDDIDFVRKADVGLK
jgi:adenylate cyclase